MWRTSKAGRIDRLVVFRAEAGSYGPVGELLFEGGGKRRLGRFAYARSYLARDAKRAIDPVGLPLRTKSSAAAPEEVPLAFHDVGPDGWGKGILDQAFPNRQLSMPEYLALGGLGRTGDLAFGPTPDAPATWVPDETPLMALPDDADDDVEALLAAAIAVDQGTGGRHHLDMLFRKSSDLGGARPKARLRHEGIDWIAKFPSWGDTFDDPRVEAVCLDVCEAAGLQVPERRVLDVAGRSVLLLRRFDRSAEGQPHGYLSVGTLLKEPSNGYATRKTYVDITEVARRVGVPDPEAEVFRRLLVNSYLHNTDDHLRNHALVDRGAGWRLSPIFDVVPQPAVRRHVCAPARDIGPEWDPDLAFAAHSRLGLPEAAASAIRDEVVAAARQLPRFMDAREVQPADREVLATAFPPEVGFSPARPAGVG